MKFFKQLTFIASLILTASCGQANNQTQDLKNLENNTKPKILVVLSAKDYVTTKEGVKHRTGFFLSEFVLPSLAMTRAGYDLVIATPGGVKPSMEPISNDVKWFKNEEELNTAREFITSQKQLSDPVALENLSNLSDFSGVFFPGGHAPMEDLSANANVGKVLNFFHDHNLPIGLICHGPAALLSAKIGSAWTFSGYRMTAFSTAEEKQEEDAGHLEGHMRFYLDEALQTQGGKIENAQPWNSSAVRDRELITGQNPMSEEAFAGLFLQALMETKLSKNKIESININSNVKLKQNKFYSIAEKNPKLSSWENGYTTLWIGYKANAQDHFMQRITPHVRLTLNQFKDKGLTGYLVYTTENYEVAYLRWSSKEVANKAFASDSGKAVTQDASTFMGAVLFKEVEASSVPGLSK